MIDSLSFQIINIRPTDRGKFTQAQALQLQRHATQELDKYCSTVKTLVGFGVTVKLTGYMDYLLTVEFRTQPISKNSLPLSEEIATRILNNAMGWWVTLEKLGLN